MNKKTFFQKFMVSLVFSSLFLLSCRSTLLAKGEKNWRWGLYVGPNFSNYTGEYSGNYPSSHEGLLLGAFLEYKISVRLAFQPEIAYIEKGDYLEYKVLYDYYDPWTGWYLYSRWETEEAEETLIYTEFPIIFKY